MQAGHGCSGPHWSCSHDFVLSVDEEQEISFDPAQFVPRGSASNFGKKLLVEHPGAK